MPFRRVRLTAVVTLVVFVCLAAILQTGCAPKLVPEPIWEKDARALLDQADSLVAKKQYGQAVKTADTFLYQYPTSRYRDRALSLLGDIRFTQRDYTKALAFYKELIQEFPASPFLIPAKSRLGQCYFELKEYDSAIANLEDRSRITDPVQLLRISEMLAVAYNAKKNYVPATREYAYLALNAASDAQRSGYRDRVREIIEKDLAEDDLKTLAVGTPYPADLARLRLAGLLIEQRRYADAVAVAKVFLERYPDHPEKTRAEMLLNDATAKLTAPRYMIGALLPQSGQLAFFGDRVLKGIQLAIHLYNLQNPQERVELTVKDTEGSPEKAVAALNDLASAGAVAVIGPLMTKEAEALAPMLDKRMIPAITPAASGEGIGRISPWLFRNALTNSSQAAEAAQFAVKLKPNKIVIFYPDDAYGKDLTRTFTRDLDRKADILASIAYPPDVKDFGPYIRRLMEIDLRSRRIEIPEDDAARKQLFQDYTPGFGAIYLPGYAERVGLLIPQLAFYNITGITMIGSNNWHSQDLIERAQRHVEGALFVDGFFPESEDPSIKSVIDAYRSAYQDDPDILAAQAYDSTSMVLSLLKEHKDTPQAIKDGLSTLKDFHGITGITSFAGTGEARKTPFLITVRDGKFVLYTGEK